MATPRVRSAKPAAAAETHPDMYRWHCPCGRWLLELDFIPPNGRRLNHRCGACGRTLSLTGCPEGAKDSTGRLVAARC